MSKILVMVVVSIRALMSEIVPDIGFGVSAAEAVLVFLVDNASITALN